jgi:ubiquinone biosynthesis protein COQ4
MNSVRRKVDWRRAWRAISVLRADPERIDMTFEVLVALDGGQMEHWYQSFLAEPDGPSLLDERPSLLQTLSDFEALQKYPENSFGRAYVALMQTSQRAADGLNRAKAMAPAVEEVCQGPERQWFLERNGCAHDLLHVLTGYGQDWAGETALLAFEHGLWPMRARRLGLLGVMMTAPPWVYPYMVRAWKRGRRARIPHSFRWESALLRPLEEVRRELAVHPFESTHKKGLLQGGQRFGPWRYQGA